MGASFEGCRYRQSISERDREFRSFSFAAFRRYRMRRGWDDGVSRAFRQRLTGAIR